MWSSSKCRGSIPKSARARSIATRVATSGSDLVDLGWCGEAEAAGQSHLAHTLGPAPSLRLGHLLGIAHARQGTPDVAALEGEHHGGGHQRAGEGAAPDLVEAGDGNLAGRRQASFKAQGGARRAGGAHTGPVSSGGGCGRDR